MSRTIKFHTACFSTNLNNFSLTSIIKQYLLTADFSDMKDSEDNLIEFKNKIVLENEDEILVHNTYYEISSFSESIQIFNKVECLIIFFDLEFNESLIELNKIFKHIDGSSFSDKKIFVIKIYTNNNNIESNLDEESIKNCFSNYSLNNYEIVSTVNMDSSDELVEAIDKLTQIAIEEKIESNDWKNIDNSNSFGCSII